jgi:large subunit ribosomal protein L21
MYAIIKTGGKQHRVSVGEILRVEKLGPTTGAFRFDEVLLVSKDGQVQIGSPVVANAHVEAEIIREARAKKIIIFKKKRRKGYHKKQGHRQYFTEVKITNIVA